MDNSLAKKQSRKEAKAIYHKKMMENEAYRANKTKIAGDAYKLKYIDGHPFKIQMKKQQIICRYYKDGGDRALKLIRNLFI